VKFPATESELRASPIFNEQWYYCFELLPGVITRGAAHLNIGLTRRLFSKMDLADRSVLDIGTMEAAIPVLAKRRGAKFAAGIDADRCDDKIEAVKHYMGQDFHYSSGIIHSAMQEKLSKAGHQAFDVIILSGVLYHCFGPLHTLAYARSMLRTGGLMIIETWGIESAEPAMYFNSAGRFGKDPSTFFLPTTSLLNYVLRYFKLQPIDCVWIAIPDVAGLRVAVVCRATDEVLNEGDEWMLEATNMVDYKTLIDWDNIASAGSTFVPYQGREHIIDVHSHVVNSNPQAFSREDAIIRMNDVS
jgi:2-polyprenyl-3-methyl-5-hydroxy-6-metoxy-1,4-benzoquinol methylase